MGAAINYARLMSDEGLSEAIYVRISKSDREALEALASRMPLKSAAIARIALRIGLQAIEKDPGAIFTAGKPPKKGAR
jgi:hypothetical protein